MKKICLGYHSTMWIHWLRNVKNGGDFNSKGAGSLTGLTGTQPLHVKVCLNTMDKLHLLASQY